VTAPRVHTGTVMDTMVSIEIVGRAGRDDDAAVSRAFDWFRRIESACSRFSMDSEVHRLIATVGAPTAVSDVLFETARLAIALAEETEGAFDPTVGRMMEQRGFDREYRSGSAIATAVADGPASYRDVEIDVDNRTITLHRPLVLDLGAVAKGFAVDMAARELAHLEHFAIDAGGDLYLAGTNAHGAPWSVGIRHPRRHAETIETITVSNAAVCTSGDYLRVTTSGHHIIDARRNTQASSLASVTVVAPLAMIADALSTAAFVLGPVDGLALIARHGAEGLLITPQLERIRTRES
jgi:thiamine biosynthesis lipoprotein